MPEVEALADRLGERVKLVKVNAPENRQICRDLRVFGLPTYLVFKDGEEVERLAGDPSLQEVEDAVDRVLGGE
jgi:thioredoxin 1